MHWHGLAKLRLHSDITLEILDKQTTQLGDALRAFQSKTCTAFETLELKREAEARKRKAIAKAQKTSRAAAAGRKVKGKQRDRGEGPGLTSQQVGAQGAEATALDDADEASKSGRKTKAFSGLNGYKPHALGDYVAIIKEYGTTDSYSTEPVSAHGLRTASDPD